ncbi:MAG: hypothetical protein ACON49_07370 [Candidatus Puniceispirillaceae bacterium]
MPESMDEQKSNMEDLRRKILQLDENIRGLRRQLENQQKQLVDMSTSLNIQGYQARDIDKLIGNLGKKQLQKLMDLDNSVKTRTALVPYICFGILAVAVATGGSILGLF